MSRLSYESVEYGSQPSVKAFLTSIGLSCFHWHYEYEFLLVLQGQINVRTDNHDLLLSAGDLLLVNSKTLHSIVSDQTGGNIVGLVQLDPQLFHRKSGDDRAYSFIVNSRDPEEEPKCGFDQFRRRLSRILLCTMEDTDENYFRMRAEVMGLVADLFEYSEYDILMKSSVQAAESLDIMKVIEHIRLHLAEEDLTEKLPREFGVSDKTLYLYFSSTLGLSTREFIEEMKIQKARRYLKNTDHDISYIIDSCGFGSEASFYRSFRKAVGQSPASYRKSFSAAQEEDTKIQGYLDYQAPEAEKILRDFVKQSRQ